MALTDAQSSEVTFLSGFAADGTLAPTAFATWNYNTGTPTYGNISSQAKWGGETASSSGGTVSYYFGNGVTAAQQAMYKAGLQLWQDEVNISFVQTASSTAANFSFEVNSIGKAFYLSGDPANPVGSRTAGSPGPVSDGAGGSRNPYISVDVNSGGFGTYDGTFNDGGNAFDTVVHEEGHMLGLGHAGPYNEGTSPNGTGSNSVTNQFTANDTHQYSIMSYNTPNNKTTAKYDPSIDTAVLGGNQPSTPQTLDILAAQRLYGAATAGELSKAQTFGFNCTVADASRVFFDFTNYNAAKGIAPVLTIYDSAAAGSTLDLSGFAAASRVDLNQGGFTSCGGLTNNVSIAYGTKVDTAIGGSGDDTFIVNADNDVIDGGAGSNTAVFGKAMASYAVTPNVDGSTTVLDKTTGATTRLTNIGTATFADQSMPVCFTTGTLIRVAREGREVDVAVEDLRVGDLAVTATGAHRPIRWIGHRTLDCTRHPDPQAVWPVRVAAHAFGPDRPARDLRLSLGHAVCLDMLGEVLVPAFKLLNGATVRQEEVDRVTYWHVELDSHDVILAEGLACESYIELGNRGFFQESDVVALDGTPDVGLDGSPAAGPAAQPGLPSGAAGTPAGYCRPLHLDGPVVEAARLQLRRRAEAAGWRLAAGDPLAGLHLVADGRRIDPAVRGLSASFAVPAGARELWLMAEAARPCDCGDGMDGRALGVRVAGLAVTDGFGAERRIALDDAAIHEGWHAVEGEADRPMRWTGRQARLPAALIGGEAVLLRVDLDRPALPRWVAPEAATPREAVAATEEQRGAA